MKRVAIVGAGLIGQAWAIVFARAGYRVRMWDGQAAALPVAVEMIERQARELQQHQLVAAADALIAAISVHESLEQALEGAAYVQENLPEQLPLKREIFARLDAQAPADVILASSTSSIPASQFTEALKGRARCLVAHPVNPPYLIPVVELCASPWTDAQVIERTRAIMRNVDQKPVVVHGEPQGFILNRLQGALLREAFRLVEHGHISVEDLDTTVKDGLGLRWAFMGPFETIDLNAPDGLQDYCARYGEMYRAISEEQASTQPWSSALIEKLHAERRSILPDSAREERRFWRDEYLMSLMGHKRSRSDRADH